VEPRKRGSASPLEAARGSSAGSTPGAGAKLPFGRAPAGAARGAGALPNRA
jgi:hypothetical protein